MSKHNRERRAIKMMMKMTRSASTNWMTQYQEIRISKGGKRKLANHSNLRGAEAK